MLETFKRAFGLPDLRRRLLFTLAVLLIFRFAAHIPVPGLNQAQLDALLNPSSNTAGSQAARFINFLTGGALEQFSVMTLGVYPYITASIIISLLAPLIPSLEELQKEGESGRNKINRMTYWLTIPLAVLQGVANIGLVNSSLGNTDVQVVQFGSQYPLNTATVLISLLGGTMFALWLGERITEKGIGNGISIMIFGGIITQVPQTLLSLLSSGQVFALLIVVAVTVLTVALIVYIQEAHRRIPVQYGRRMRGAQVYGGQTTFIPLRVNSAGMIPLIFASALMVFPQLLAQVLSGLEQPQLRQAGNEITRLFDQQKSLWWIVFFVFVVLFTYFYTDVVFRQQALHETLQRNGGFIPGIRPGKQTEEYLSMVMRRITFAGAVFLGLVAVLPFIVAKATGLDTNVSMLISASGLLIVVGVVLDTIKQLEAQLAMRHYEGFIR